MSTTARMRAFVAVADTGSVRAAAARLFLTESSVSASIAALARDVGVDLVRRDGRGIRLTAAGRRYATDARCILGLHERALRAARGEAEPAAGTVRIGATTSVGEFLLPDLLAGFRSAHPDVELDLVVEPTARLRDRFDHHDVDVAIGGCRPQELAPGRRAVRATGLVVVASRDAAERVRAAGPDAVTWLLPGEGSGVRATCLRLLGNPAALPSCLTLGTMGAVVAGAEAGLGVGLVPREAVRTSCATGRLVEVALPWSPVAWAWQALTHADPSATAELLVEHLLTCCGWTPPPAGPAQAPAAARPRPGA